MADPTSQSPDAADATAEEAVLATLPLASGRASASQREPAAANSAPGAASSTNAALEMPEEATDTEDRATLWLRRGDRVVVTSFLIALVVLLAIHWMRLSRWGLADVEITSQQPRETFYSLDINHASWVEWAQLDGIGEKLAKRIVGDRDERGPFATPNDVGRVRGISARLLKQMQPFLRGGTETAEPATGDQAPATSQE